jgi:hypothetical protein
MRARAFVFCSLLGAGCAPYDPNRDAKIPGDPLGTYAMVGTLKADECGADLLGAPDPWRFELKLSRFEQDLYWLNGREAIVGDIDADGSTFHFSTHIDVTVAAPAKGAPGCTVSRYDQADGTLDGSDTNVPQVEATLTFKYEPKSGSECFDIVGVPSGFNMLPCSLTYALAGERTSAAPK